MTSLTESQKRSILVACLDLHRRMAGMEALLVQGEDPSPFAEYVNDLSPAERTVVQDFFARFRAALLDWLREAGVPLEIQKKSVRWVVECGITGLELAVTELGPDRLRGYGPVDAATAAQITAVQQSLRGLVQRVAADFRG